MRQIICVLSSAETPVYILAIPFPFRIFFSRPGIVCDIAIIITVIIVQPCEKCVWQL